jgi:hypothetical protein
MKKLLALTLLLISNFGYSQIKSIVVDSETKEKLPFVNIWIQNENNGTTSNQNGEFELEIDSQKLILFSAIGYETREIKSDSIKTFVELKPTVTELDEVVLKTKKQSEKQVIGKFKKSKINHYFGTGTKPWITARYFDFNKDYTKTPFLNKIRVLTNSDIKDSKFIVRLYSVGKDGQPENYIYDENIFGIAKKGKKITEIDIADLNIEFPENGFFIAIEWLIIDENKHEYSFTMTESNKKLTGISYEPAFGTVPAETDKNSWIFQKGKWWKMFKNNNGTIKRYKDKYSLLAIELTLTN